MTVNIGILGFGGRMGQAIATAIRHHPQAHLVGGLVREQKPDLLPPNSKIIVTTEPEALFAQCDVIVDFSSAAATPVHALLAARYGKAFLAGVTGLDDAAKAVLAEAAKTIPLLFASNTSLSLVVLKHAVRLTAQLLANHDYDITIVDEHHRWKKDAPSGTAKTLGEIVLAANGGSHPPSYTAVRGGAIVGEHEVIFAGQGETIRMHHSVNDREIFARGAVTAAVWLYGKKAKMYGMDDVVSIG